MRSIALLPCLAIALSACTVPMHDAHLDALDAHLDALKSSVDALEATLTRGQAARPQPEPAAGPAPHVVCRTMPDGQRVAREVTDKDPSDIDLGTFAACPAPKAYAKCLRGQPASEVADACVAGKLPEQTKDAKDTKDKKP